METTANHSLCEEERSSAMAGKENSGAYIYYSYQKMQFSYYEKDTKNVRCQCNKVQYRKE